MEFIFTINLRLKGCLPLNQAQLSLVSLTLNPRQAFRRFDFVCLLNTLFPFQTCHLHANLMFVISPTETALIRAEEEPGSTLVVDSFYVASNSYQYVRS